MENERKKKFQDYAPPEQKPSGGYNLNGVYYSRDGQRLDDQPKKSWSQREYERAEREKIHCRAKREQRESEVDAQGNPVKDNSGVKKAIAIVVIVLGVIASIALPGSATWAVIFAIVTLISARKQKQSYDAGDWERFRTSAKKATRWLWVTLGLSCVGVVAIFGIVGIYLKSDNGTVNLLVDGALVKVNPSTLALVPHDWKAASYDKDDNVATYKCKNCGTVATVFKTKEAAEASGAATVVKTADENLPAGKWLAYTDGSTTTPSTDNKGNTSPKTFDAGIAMYVGMALTSVAGSAVVIGKKKEF